jgi:hypothetical protein
MVSAAGAMLTFAAPKVTVAAPALLLNALLICSEQIGSDYIGAAL